MEAAQDDLENQKTVESSLKRKANNLAVFFTLFLFLIFSTLLMLGVGYLWGSYRALPQQEKVVSTGAKLANQTEKNVYVDNERGFKISYPDGWVATKKTVGYSGVVFSKEDSVVEIWLTVDQPFSLSQEQKAALVTTNTLNLKIGGQTAKMTEYIYTAGNYFSIIKLSAHEKKPLVTFWIKAENQDIYSQAKAIAQSFSFN